MVLLEVLLAPKSSFWGGSIWPEVEVPPAALEACFALEDGPLGEGQGRALKEGTEAPPFLELES